MTYEDHQEMNGAYLEGLKIKLKDAQQELRAAVARGDSQAQLAPLREKVDQAQRDVEGLNERVREN